MGILNAKHFYGALILLLFLCNSCTRKKVLFIESYQGSKLTLIIEHDVMYITGGHKNSYDDDYLKLNIENIMAIDQTVYFCINNPNDWDVVVVDAFLLENKLRNIKVSFANELPLDSRNIPTAINYSYPHCFTLDYHLYRINKGKNNFYIK